MTHSEWSDIYYEKLRGMKTTVEELRQLKSSRLLKLNKKATSHSIPWRSTIWRK